MGGLHRESDGSLVVFNGGEDSRLVGGNGSIAGNDNTEDVALHGNTEGQWRNIEKEEVGGLIGCHASENGGLDGSTVGNSLIGVDTLRGLLAAEELLQELLNLGNTGRTTDKNDLRADKVSNAVTRPEPRKRVPREPRSS